MKLTSYLQDIEDIELFVEAGVEELILEPTQLSRFGKLSSKQISDYAKQLRDRGIRPILEWDILMTEERFLHAAEYFKSLDLKNIAAVRVQDPGALHFILKNFPKLNLQLILETGNHNLAAIQTWVEYVGDRLERVVLSLELPKTTLKEYVQTLKTPVEFLGLGRILLFYTPRNLVSPHFFDHDQSETTRIHDVPIEVLGSSEESPHSGFPIIENKHGTFMFNTKDHCLLENIEELEKDIGIAFFRIDLRFLESRSFISEVANLKNNFSKELADEYKALYPNKVIRGFYSINKSDVLFGKLKNKRIQRHDESYLGDVIEVVKKKHVAIMLRNSKLRLSLNDHIIFQTPDGKEKNAQIKRLWNSEEKSIESAGHEQVIFIPHTGGVSIRSAVYLNF